MTQKELNTNTQEKEKVYNLESKEDLNELSESLKSNSIYFKPEENISYKFTLTSPQMREVTTNLTNQHTGEPVIKKEFSIKAVGSDKTEFEGLFQTGKKIAKYIVDIIKDSDKSWSEITFNLSKTGSKENTRYNITEDF